MSEGEKDTPLVIERKADFARRLGVSRQYVNMLAKKGLPLTPEGNVIVADALRWVTASIETESDDAAPAPDLIAARTRLVLANAKRAELALERERTAYVPREEVRLAARAFGRAHRDQMLNFANRYGAGIAAAAGCDAATLIGLIDAQMREALRESIGIPVPFHTPDERALAGEE